MSEAANKTEEAALGFGCGDHTLVGVLHMPPSAPSVGAIIVVGGPQYRVGSHRQFVLLARSLAAHGVAVLRFDCRGMGDSEGEFPGFENIEPDIGAAVDALSRRFSSLSHIVLWGLCDATLAIAEYARRDSRIGGVALLNPWVRSEASLARTQLKHYYVERLMQRDFLRKVMRGEFNMIESGRSFVRNIGRALGGRGRAAPAGSEHGSPVAERLLSALQRFGGPVLLVLSGRDLTAKEFLDAAGGSGAWQKLLAEKRLTRRDLAVADHTFSRRVWRDQVAEWTWEWIEGSTRSPRE